MVEWLIMVDWLIGLVSGFGLNDGVVLLVAVVIRENLAGEYWVDSIGLVNGFWLAIGCITLEPS